MAKYRGYFSDYNCKKYEVRIETDGAEGDYEDILLAGDQPFVVRYNESETPFEPVRTSTASISIVHDDYLEDALSNCAQDTKVELLDITTETATTLWIGYLTPNTMDAGYERCYETFELEAADCISSLQYVDYTEFSGGGIVTIKSILNQICDAAGLLEGYYWTRSKKVGASTIMLPNNLSISEHNFQTNDTEEEWKLSEVLKEICRYFGFTCLQYGKRMYFIDYQYLEVNDDIYATYYAKSSSYASAVSSHLDGAYTVTSGSYLSNGATITFEPVYNKVVVNANMYAAEEFIPSPFNDKYLTNRRSPSGDFYTNFEITPITPDQAQYPHGSTWYSAGFEQNYATEKSGDTKYRYFHRLYDHKYWESVYSYVDGTPMPIPNATAATITKSYRGGTIVDLGVVRKDYRSDSGQWIVPSKLDYTRYLCICQKHRNPSSYSGTNPGASKVVFKLKDGFKSRVMLGNNAFLVLYCSALFERHDNRNYINPSWEDTESTTNFMAAGHYKSIISSPMFRIQVGNKGWSSYQNKWVDSTSSDNYVRARMRWDEKNHSFWNHEIEILNNVSWEDKVNAEGIKIPLSGIDTTQEIVFEVLNPAPAFYGNTGNPNFEDKFYDTNAYCWMKDFSLKCCYDGQDGDGNDSDVVYENEISGCSVNDMDEIRVRLTTYVENVKPSYSHVIYGATTKHFLSGVTEESIPRDVVEPLKPEENIIQKYVHQYSTPTKKISLTLSSDIKPFQKLFGVDVENQTIGYVQLGTEIDYRTGRQTITTIQKNK